MSQPPPVMPEEAQSATLASLVFERLREDILEGVLAPGEKLRIEALQDRYSVGASPIREALNRLTSVRLVEQVERRGFRVVTVSNEDLLDLLHARRLLNEVIVRESVTRGDEAWEQELVYAYHRMWRCPMTLPSGQVNREWELMHRRFHAALIAACPSKWLLEFHEVLFDSADRHRRLNAQGLDAEFTRNEHREIMEAAVSRDAVKAVRLLNQSMEALVPSTAETGAAPSAP